LFIVTYNMLIMCYMMMMSPSRFLIGLKTNILYLVLHKNSKT